MRSAGLLRSSWLEALRVCRWPWRRLVEPLPVEALLPHCQFLSIHCPATPETHHLLNAERIALLPDDAVVVNTARGAVVYARADLEHVGRRSVIGTIRCWMEDAPTVTVATAQGTYVLPH
mgnify:CR=1 FL=1